MTDLEQRIARLEAVNCEALEALEQKEKSEWVIDAYNAGLRARAEAAERERDEALACDGVVWAERCYQATERAEKAEEERDAGAPRC